MAEPFKNLLNEAVVNSMADTFKEQYIEFDTQSFKSAINSQLSQLELKARTDLITDQLINYLPNDFTLAANILLSSLSPVEEKPVIESTGSTGINGWAIVPLTYFVARSGLKHFALSMTLFKAMTQRLSAEFGIRYFLMEHPEKTIDEMKCWAMDENVHIRRLASEGCRPRLPWGIRLNPFVKDPSLVIEVLEMLKDDPQEYVRRSVANNLNDIAKDHPDRVADLMEKWLVNASEERKRLINHACRTLIKTGHQKTLTILGYHKAKLKEVLLSLEQPEVSYGGSLDFSLTLASNSDKNQLLMIDYIVHHQKANGTTSPKVFKWKKVALASEKTLAISKKHAIKPITTRVYYPGVHYLEVMINGKSVAKTSFELRME